MSTKLSTKLSKRIPDNISVRKLTELGAQYQQQGKLYESEEAYRKALDGRENLLSADHPDTLSSVEDYAKIMELRLKFDEAEKLYIRAVEGKQKIFGKLHIQTLEAIIRQGDFYRKIGRNKEALRLYNEVTDRCILSDEIQEDHPLPLKVLNRIETTEKNMSTICVLS